MDTEVVPVEKLLKKKKLDKKSYSLCYWNAEVMSDDLWICGKTIQLET